MKNKTNHKQQKYKIQKEQESSSEGVNVVSEQSWKTGFSLLSQLPLVALLCFTAAGKQNGVKQSNMVHIYEGIRQTDVLIQDLPNEKAHRIAELQKN